VPTAPPFDAAGALARVPLFAQLAADELADVASRLQAGKVQAGQGLPEGGGRLVLVRRGRARVLTPGLGGQLVASAELGPGDAFGVAALLGQETGAVLEGAEDLAVLVLDDEDMAGVAARFPSVAAALAGRPSAVVPAGGILRPMSWYACDAEKSELSAGEGVAGTAAVADDVVQCPGDAELAPAEPSASAAVAIPLRRGNRAIGVLALYARGAEQAFTDDDMRLLQSLVRQAETAIENTFLYEEATRLSITDGLTGLWNRRLFDLRINEELQRAIRFQEPFGLLLVDLDHFKSVNDRYGHQAGDAVLVELARRLTDATREVDVVTRFGGEEFALILPKTPVQGTLRLAEKVREVVANEPFSAGNASMPVTVSVGAAGYPAHGLSAAELLAAAGLPAPAAPVVAGPAGQACA